jgi:hypothetical protein
MGLLAPRQFNRGFKGCAIARHVSDKSLDRFPCHDGNLHTSFVVAQD